MVLHHFLVVAAALIGRPASHCEAEESSVGFAAVEELLIELEESHVGVIFIWGPEGAVEAMTLLSETYGWVD